jgi:predicted RNase H-like HicB family nuclease
MSKKSRNSSKINKVRAETLTKPFDKSTLNKAKKIANSYSIVLNPSPRLGFIGTSIELPTVFTDSKTMEQCCKNTREALTITVATMIECGQRPPSPASEKRRNVQVNIRLTAEEKEKLTRNSRNFGFKGVSDFVRYAALKVVASESKLLY